MGGLDFAAIMDLVNGIMGATRPKEDGEGSQIDTQKVAMVVLTFAGRQGLSWVLNQRRQKREVKMLAKGIKPGSETKKKGNKFGPVLLVGAGLGLAGYLLIMKPEDREALFKQVDKTINDVTGLVNELQGKPYSNDYERKN